MISLSLLSCLNPKSIEYLVRSSEYPFYPRTPQIITNDRQSKSGERALKEKCCFEKCSSTFGNAYNTRSFAFMLS
jgi:hypothetical protein